VIVAISASALFAVLQCYQTSEDFGGLAERTREDYAAQIKLIENASGRVQRAIADQSSSISSCSS
jgi:hypothetical protein